MRDLFITTAIYETELHTYMTHTDTLAKMIQEQQYQVDVISVLKTK